MEIVAVIPARYGSTRFEGKPLADVLGKPMIQRVYEGVSGSKLIDEVWVATDDRRILETVQGFGGKAVMTSSKHTTGSERVAEVARRLDAEIVVNVQGDEPLLRGSIVDRAIRPVLKDSTIDLSTLMTPIRETRDWLHPNIVKVIADRKGFALYFSRAPIPYPRDTYREGLPGLLSASGPLPHRVCKHIGVYVFRRDFLLRYTRMKPTPLETLEKLEQLRILEHGFRIKMTEVDYEPLCVDTPEDLQNLVAYLSRHPELA
jgi:3-deoxy-manno-octulosonate cytidylyltransferase (CMP-KDO synthetase)